MLKNQQEIKNAQYFSISLDSTPGISHVDQISFCVHYVNKNGKPIEKMLCFLDNVDHQYAKKLIAVLNLLNNYNLNIKYLRGQSFDNANNIT